MPHPFGKCTLYAISIEGLENTCINDHLAGKGEIKGVSIQCCQLGNEKNLLEENRLISQHEYEKKRNPNAEQTSSVTNKRKKRANNSRSAKDIARLANQYSNLPESREIRLTNQLQYQNRKSCNMN